MTKVCNNKLQSRWAEFTHVLLANPLMTLSFGILLIFILIGITAPHIAPYPPYETNPDHQLQAPSIQHFFGTDQYGQDIFSRVLYGTRLTFLIAIMAVVCGLLVGATLGAIAGYYGGFIDEVVMRSMDTLQAFPTFILALAVAAAVGPGLITLIMANGIVNVPLYARIVRSKMISEKESLYTSAAICAGNKRRRIIFVHLLPNCIGPIIIQSTLQAGWAILCAAGLSFLGLGLRMPAAEWGAMIQMGASYMVSGHWWIAFFPGIAIVIGVLGFNILGDGLQNLLDPRRKRV